MALICPLTHFYNINPKTKQLHRKERLIQPCVFSGGGTLCVLRQIYIDQYWSILTALKCRRRDFCIDHRSILININQYWPPLPAGGEICITTIDQCWSILINIDQYWTILTALTRQRPGEICIFTIDQYWSGGGGGQWRNGELDKWKRQIRHRHFSPFFAIFRHFSPLVVFKIKHFRH